MKPRPPIFGIVAEFESPRALLDAARRAHAEGYRRMDAFTPFPIDELSEAIGFRRTRVPLIVLIGGIIGAFTGFFLQYYSAVIDWPLNVGGRPLNSWPAFIPITFELMVLFAAFSAVIGMLALNGLPRPHHPLFNVSRFALATRDRFFLCIEAEDPKFDRTRTREFLERLKPTHVDEVEW